MLSLKRESELRQAWLLANIRALNFAIWQARERLDYYEAWLNVVDVESNAPLVKKMLFERDKTESFILDSLMTIDQAKQDLSKYAPSYNQDDGNHELPF